MRFYADLHVHSKYSRATSRNCDLEHLAFWARKKGIAVVGTGDFTHPAWRDELQTKLVPAEPGLFRLRPDLERAVDERLPPACRGPVRFLLSVEISTIYKKGERTRKIHHLIYTPDFESAGRVVTSLDKIGNLHSDGRPILGLDSRHLLEIALESGPGSYLVPAHVWTPWFAALGSKSGFDSIADCYGDLASHVFAIETGLSSDPEMNWLVSSLDRYRLVSNSDAHSPEKLGREACEFDGELDYFGIRRALETGEGYVGTVEFFPEEGKYHLDGHRKCGVRLSPAETREHDGRCPVCGKPLTVGVMHRVHDLADREESTPPATAGAFRSLVPLPEILSEIQGVGPKTKTVARSYERLVSELGPELTLLDQVPLDDVRRASSSLLADALDRLRRGDVRREAGYDGEYGRIRLFGAEELKDRTRGNALFALPEPEPKPRRVRDADEARPSGSSSDERDVVLTPAPRATTPTLFPGAEPPAGGAYLLAALDSDQERVARLGAGPALVVAGPGAGKTRALTHRLAYLVAERGVAPAECLAITFTRRAADEMRARLDRLLGPAAGELLVTTFHGLGYRVLSELRTEAGLQRGFRVAPEEERVRLLGAVAGVSETKARRLLGRISNARRAAWGDAADGGDDAELREARASYREALEEQNLVDFDDLVERTLLLLEHTPEARDALRRRWPWISVDELQDVDPVQYRLLRALAPADGNLCAIGDPDQSIYGFRGADARLFERFQADWPSAEVVRLARNYRSAPVIVEASTQALARERDDPPVAMQPDDGQRISIHAAATERAEAEHVVASIEALLGGHSFYSIDTGRSSGEAEEELSFADVAVLYRTEAQAEALAEALDRAGFPYQRRSHGPLSEHPAVACLLARFAATPPGAPLAERLRAAAERADDRALALVGVELLAPFAADAGDDAAAFLSAVALAAQADTWDPRADRIALFTLHASKGLEFAVVFLAGCEDGLLPLRFGGRAAADEAEERRLFYVGLTRARRRLYLSWAKKRSVRGKRVEREASPFLAAVEERLLARSRTRGRRAPTAAEQLDLFGA